MKRIIIIALTILTSFSSAGQIDIKEPTSVGPSPEPVYSIVKIQHSIPWYEQQMRLWKAEVDKDNKNGEAWYNYYAACRALKNLDHDNWDAHNKLCTEIAEQAYNTIPNSFHGNFLKFWNSGLEPGSIQYLHKAHEINPTDIRPFDDMMIQGELTGDKDMRSKYAELMYKHRDISPHILNWGYNLLSEIHGKGVVFTQGDNDTYAAWICQDVKGLKTDAHVLNINLLFLEDYRNQKFEQLGLPAFEKDRDEFGKDAGALQVALIKHVLDHYKSPKYFAVTVSENVRKHFEDNLYLIGLNYQYNTNNIDNLARIRKNYEKNYLMDYLQESFGHDMSEGVVNHMNATYLPALLKLYKHMTESGDHIASNKLRRIVFSIADKAGVTADIMDHLNNDTGVYPGVSQFRNMALDLRKLEKSFGEPFRKVRVGLYEVTNQEYRTFLNNLLSSRKMDLYKACLYDSSQWTEKFPATYNEPMKNMYHWHAAYNDYPVVNVSHEAALKYCEWLTQQYNVQRKRKHEKVLFRLPNEKEWEEIACANKGNKLPWGGTRLTSADGNFRANHRPSEGKFMDDGAFHTAKVASYPMNDHRGYYDVIGNVAEMVTEHGIAKGGSWYSLPEECYIQEQMKYEGPDPRVGFRVVMEIIEE